MTWRLAKSLESLRAQINAAAPARSKVADGTIGDAAHASRSSDHNPHVKDGKMGVVTALDITHDPRNGVDAGAIAEALKASGDARIKYIIWNRRIWNPAKGPNWRAYTRANPHDKHFHISVASGKALYDDGRAWTWGKAAPKADAPAIVARPLLMQGITGHDAEVAEAKAALMKALAAEKGFGPLLDGLTQGFQRHAGLGADGKIGAYTWDKL
jgi:murein L,D-transpeptidase YcbB/YkuD